MIVKTLKKHLAVLSVLLVMTPAVYAQKVTAEFRNAPVADVLKEIEKQTGCSFVYKTSDIKEAKASGSFKDAPLADVLLKVITPPLTYSIEGNIIAISIFFIVYFITVNRRKSFFTGYRIIKI